MLLIEKKLDQAFQELSKGKICWYCSSKAMAIHHIIRRSNKTHRWSKENGTPVCLKCHMRVHMLELPEREIDFKVYNYSDFKRIFNFTDREYLEEKAKEYGIKYNEKDFTKKVKNSLSLKKNKVKSEYEINLQNRVNKYNREFSKKVYKLIKQRKKRLT